MIIERLCDFELTQEVTLGLGGGCPKRAARSSQIRKERVLTWKERSMQSGPAAFH